MNWKKSIFSFCISILMLFVVGNVFSQENTELQMPDAGISMQALLYLFNFEIGEADELAFIHAGDNDTWQGRQALSEGFRYQFYIVNFVENSYGVFATDQTSERRTTLHFYHQGSRFIEDFYSENVPPMVMFDPNDQYIFLTEDFRLVENYYTELSNQFENLQAQHDQAMRRYEEAREERREAMTRVQELEETDAAYNEAVVELEEKNMELLHALSELDASEYEVERLQSRIREFQAQVSSLENENQDLNETVAALEDENQDLNETITAQQETIEDLEELKDPYKVRLREIDREGITPYLNIKMGLDNPDANNNEIVPFADAELGAYITNERIGMTYAVFSIGGDINSEGQYGIRPQMIISLPNEIFKVGVRGNIGTSGYDSFIYERSNSGFNATVSPFASMNILGRESRVGLEGGIEASTEESATAYYFDFNYYLNPIEFPWLTFALDRVSFANIVGSDVSGSRFRTEAGFDINWSAGVDRDPGWVGYTHTWFFRLAYQVDTDSIENRVSDDVGFIIGLTLSFN